MRYKNAIIALGILIAISLSPFIGIPRSWKEGIAGLLALLISTLAYLGARPKAPAPAPTPVATPSVSITPEPPTNTP